MGRGRSLQSLDKDGRERVLQLLMVSTWSDLPCVFALSAESFCEKHRIEDTTTSCHLELLTVRNLNRTVERTRLRPKEQPSIV